MIKQAIFLFIFCVSIIFSQSTISLTKDLPNAYLGSWYGNLNIENAKGKLYSIQMELHISKTDTANRWNYTIVYVTPERRDERKYALIKVDSLPGLYQVDENNGIFINEVQIGNKMFQRFQVEQSMLIGITTYEKNKIIWEMISDNKEIFTQSGYGNAEIPYVYSFMPSNYQSAVLTKKKPKQKKKK